MMVSGHAGRLAPAKLVACLALVALAVSANASAQAAAKNSASAATTQLYSKDDKACRNDDDYASEGESFVRLCPGMGRYRLEVRGDDPAAPNYGIVTADRDFSVYLHVDPEGDAGKYARADRYDEVLDRSIEWVVDDRGRPYAVIARARLYKPGAAKATRKPLDAVYLVRGLAGYEGLVIDLPESAAGAYVPVEQARRAAAQFRSQHPH